MKWILNEYVLMLINDVTIAVAQSITMFKKRHTQ